MDRVSTLTCLDGHPIGRALGPKRANGTTGRGAFNLYHDQKNNTMFVGSHDNSNSKEYLHKDGRVVGNENKSYTIRLNPTAPAPTVPFDIGHALGPNYGNGISANGSYRLYHDPNNDMMFIKNVDDSNEYLFQDGRVFGNKDKSYAIQLHSSVPSSK